MAAKRICPLSSNDPHAIAIHPSMTYGDLDRLASRAASALSMKGLKRGDRIALAAHSNWQTISILFAAWRLSIIVALVSPRLPSISLMNSLRPLQPCFFIDDSSALFDAPFYEKNELDESAPALLLPTSGSSGAPKWAAFSLHPLLESAQTIAKILGAAAGDRHLLSLPLYHVGGLGAALRAFCSSGTLVIEDKSLPYPDRMISANTRFASLVPTQLFRLLKTDFPPIKTELLIGGAPMAKKLYEKALEKGLFLHLTYGLTEMSSTVLLTSKPVWLDELPYLGHPLPGREMKLIDQEICVRGECLFAGYGTTPERPFDDWFFTGDTGCFHEQHGYAIRGRKDFQFISGGENIQPEEIETAILSHPDVEQAIVVPLFDAEFGARIASFVKGALSSQSLAGFLSEILPKHKIPALFLPWPENENFKPNRRQLIDQFNKNYH
jgi:o-succinylbenzoate---CoA ligase